MCVHIHTHARGHSHTCMSDDTLQIDSSSNSWRGEVNIMLSGQEGLQLDLYCFSFYGDNIFMYFLCNYK